MAAGVIKTLSSADRSYYTTKDVQELLGVGRDKSYEMVRSMRSELIADGKLTEVYPKGRIPKKYFDKKCMI
ncbi:MAG: helix-turn-helix domain-containing protein [Lachnospiraceae bacterium]|nr:helix-turn-helix domain-containing protein [Lachnospiraceae bacterium]